MGDLTSFLSLWVVEVLGGKMNLEQASVPALGFFLLWLLPRFDLIPQINVSQITLKGPVMTQVQAGEKTSTRGDLDTEVIRTFDKEVNII